MTLNLTPSSLRRLGGTLALVGLCAIAALMLVPALLGYQRYVIDGRSMTGAIDRGSLVFDKPVPTARLRVGDVITYTSPLHTRITHRIVSVGRGRAFQTKGDANRSPDPWKFTLTRPTQARVAFTVPYAGWAYAALGLRWVRIIVIGLPAALIALGAIRREVQPA